jgi:hypothetical protein
MIAPGIRDAELPFDAAKLPGLSAELDIVNNNSLTLAPL